eukprot:gene18776-biopygen5444
MLWELMYKKYASAQSTSHAAPRRPGIRCWNTPLIRYRRMAVLHNLMGISAATTTLSPAHTTSPDVIGIAPPHAPSARPDSATVARGSACAKHLLPTADDAAADRRAAAAAAAAAAGAPYHPAPAAGLLFPAERGWSVQLRVRGWCVRGSREVPRYVVRQNSARNPRLLCSSKF